MNTKMVCLGDSITWGFPYGPPYSWVEICQQALGFPMLNRGVNGDTAQDLLVRLSRDVIKHEPSHCFIMAGTNDASIKISLKSFQETVKAIHELALNNSIQTVIGLPVPSSDTWLEYTLQKYRLWLASYAVDNHLEVVDFACAMTKPDGSFNPELYVDDVHPNKSGYQAMARHFTAYWLKHK